jgi:hypothetical protein
MKKDPYQGALARIAELATEEGATSVLMDTFGYIRRKSTTGRYDIALVKGATPEHAAHAQERTNRVTELEVLIITHESRIAERDAEIATLRQIIATLTARPTP